MLLCLLQYVTCYEKRDHLGKLDCSMKQNHDNVQLTFYRCTCNCEHTCISVQPQTQSRLYYALQYFTWYIQHATHYSWSHMTEPQSLFCILNIIIIILFLLCILHVVYQEEFNNFTKTIQNLTHYLVYSCKNKFIQHWDAG